MNSNLNEELISAYFDGELSSSEMVRVESMISAQPEWQAVYDRYAEVSRSLKESAAVTAEHVALPSTFLDSVMQTISNSEIEMSDSDASAQTVTVSHRSNSNTNRFVSLRTLIEAVGGIAAIVMIALLWNGTQSDPDSNRLADNSGGPGTGENRKKSDVRMMSVDGKKKANQKDPAKNDPDGGPANVDVDPGATSREFSIFVDQAVRPQIDRFWIMSNYELDAPEKEDASPVNVLLLDAKRQDAIRFLKQLKKWDSQFQVFQDSGSKTNANWLAATQIEEIEQAEGSFWKLRIVLIAR